MARCFLHLIFNAGSEYADRTSQVNVFNCCEPLKLGSQYSWVQSSTKTKLFILQNKTYLRYHQFFFGRMLFTCFIRFFCWLKFRCSCRAGGPFSLAVVCSQLEVLITGFLAEIQNSEKADLFDVYL